MGAADAGLCRSAPTQQRRTGHCVRVDDSTGVLTSPEFRIVQRTAAVVVGALAMIGCTGGSPDVSEPASTTSTATRAPSSAQPLTAEELVALRAALEARGLPRDLWTPIFLDDEAVS